MVGPLGWQSLVGMGEVLVVCTVSESLMLHALCVTKSVVTPQSLIQFALQPRMFFVWPRWIQKWSACMGLFTVYFVVLQCSLMRLISEAQ